MRKIDLILENIRDEYMINLLEEGTASELETLKTKKFLNENLNRIRKMLIEEGTLDGVKEHLGDNWGKYLAESVHRNHPDIDKRKLTGPKGPKIQRARDYTSELISKNLSERNKARKSEKSAANQKDKNYFKKLANYKDNVARESSSRNGANATDKDIMKISKVISSQKK